MGGSLNSHPYPSLPPLAGEGTDYRVLNLCCYQQQSSQHTFQAETFAKPKTQQEIVNAPSFPRRRESWLNSRNGLFLHTFMNVWQDSRLRGNDGISYFQAAAGVLQRFQGCLCL